MAAAGGPVQQWVGGPDKKASFSTSTRTQVLPCLEAEMGLFHTCHSQPPRTLFTEHPVSDSRDDRHGQTKAQQGGGGREDNRTTATSWLATCLIEEGTKIHGHLGLRREGSQLMGVGAPPRNSAQHGHTVCSLTSEETTSLTASSKNQSIHITLHSFILPEIHPLSSPVYVCLPDLYQSSRGLSSSLAPSHVPGSSPSMSAELSAQSWVPLSEAGAMMALCLVHRLVPIFSVKESEAQSRWLLVLGFPFHLCTSLSAIFPVFLEES